ncbi:phage tail tip fiber protein, partial [Yersinia pestis]
RVEADKTIATHISKLEAQLNDDISAAIVSEQEARATADETLSRQITTLQAKVEGDISAALTEEQIARATADEALSKQITQLKAQNGEDIKAAVAEETQARTDADGALASQISSLKAQTAEDIKAAVDTETKARTDADSALAGQITNLQAQTGKDINAAITSEATARANADGALGKRIDTVKAEVDGNSALIQQQAKAIADTDKKVSAAWTLKMETSTSGGQKYVAGIALGIDSTGLSQFLVQADRFGLVNSVNGKITTPFVIENSVAYMNGAYIKDGTITNAKIGNVIQSNDYAAGSRGWIIPKDGSPEFNNGTFRGNIAANSGTLNNVTIAQNCQILGKLHANQIDGDIVKAYMVNGSSIYIAPQTFARIIYVVNGYYYNKPSEDINTYSWSRITEYTVNGVKQQIYGMREGSKNQSGLFGYYNLPAGQSATVDVYTWHRQRKYDHRVNEPYLILVFKA